MSNVTTQKDLKEIKNTWEKLMEKQRTNIDLLHGNKSLVTFLSVKRSIITHVISQYFEDSKKGVINLYLFLYTKYNNRKQSPNVQMASLSS